MGKRVGGFVLNGRCVNALGREGTNGCFEVRSSIHIRILRAKTRNPVWWSEYAARTPNKAQLVTTLVSSTFRSS